MISRRGRWLLAGLAAMALLAALLAGLAWRQLQPERLTPLLLREASQALGLELRVREPAEYWLRPEPRLVLRGLSAHRPGEEAALLSAERAELSLPWATLRGHGLEITRVDLLKPRLDLPRLLAWLDARPPGEAPVRLPTLTRGLGMADASVVAPDWHIDALDIDMPGFRPGHPTRLDATGRLHAAGGRVLPFAVGLDGAAQWKDDALALALAALELQVRDGEDGATVAYRIALAGDAGIGGGRAWLESPHARLRADLPDRQAYARLELEPLRITHASGTTTLAHSAFTLDGSRAVPALDGQLHAEIDQSLRLQAHARMQQWPEAWPALPEPLAGNGGPFLAGLAYEGPLDLGAPMDLEVSHEQASLQARFLIADLIGWSLPASGSPLPPLSGRLQATSLQLGNTRLEGVSVVVHEPDGTEGNAADPVSDPDLTP